MSRYGHLLQPIRDLAENWNVDVARELETYMSEIEKLSFSFEGATGTFNFAEAALLIQGSACVYSRKVEYLYKLVYETLDLLASKRFAQQSSINELGEDADAHDLLLLDKQAEDEACHQSQSRIRTFLSLDDLPNQQDEASLKLKERQRTKQEIEALSLKFMPPTLLPTEVDGLKSQLYGINGTTIGNRHDYRMNTSIVHNSGALLPGMEDIQLADLTLPMPSRSCSSAPSQIVGATSHAADPMSDADCSFGNDDCGIFDDDRDNDYGIQEGANNAGAFSEGGLETETVVHSQKSGMKQSASTSVKGVETFDPWHRIDPHNFSDSVALSARESPFVRMTKYRLPKSLSIKNHPKLSSERQKSREQEKLLPLSTFFDNVQQKNRTRRRAARNPLFAINSAFSEIEHRIEIEQRRRTAIRRQFVRQQYKKQAQETQGQLNDFNVQETPHNWQGYNQNEANQFGDDCLSDDNFGHGDFEPDDDFDDVEVMDLTSATPQAIPADNFYQALGQGESNEAFRQAYDDPSTLAVTTTYEQLVRLHVARYVAESQKYVQETDLSRRVQEWENKIKPVLDEEASHRPFNIYEYGTEILSGFDSEKKDKCPFSNVVETEKPYEISRKFLATLQLANSGNVTIEQSRNDDGSSEFDDVNLTLLSKQRNRDWLEAKLLTAGKVYSRTGDILDVDDAGEDAESSEPDR
eukprot:gene181-3570_t